MRPCGLSSEVHTKLPHPAPIQRRCQQAPVCAVGGGSKEGSKRRRPGKEGSTNSKQVSADSGVPPPPPTTAPPAAPARALKPITAYRRAKPSLEQRRSEREAREAAAAEAGRANTKWSDAKTLKQALEDGPGRARQVTLLLIDGYNFINRDPQLAALVAAGASDRARTELHRRLLRYTADGSTEAVVVYDAYRTRANGVSSNRLSPYLQVAYANDCEADTLLIAEAERLRAQFMKDPKTARRVLVVSDDRRIQEACGPTGWVLAPGDSASSDAYDEVTAVTCSCLIDTLQRFERTLRARGAGGVARQAPSLQQDTAAWAEAFLREVHPQPDARPRARPPGELGYVKMWQPEQQDTTQVPAAGPPAGLTDAELEAMLESELSPLSSLDDLLGDDISKRFGLEDIL